MTVNTLNKILKITLLIVFYQFTTNCIRSKNMFVLKLNFIKCLQSNSDFSKKIKEKVLTCFYQFV